MKVTVLLPIQQSRFIFVALQIICGIVIASSSITEASQSKAVSYNELKAAYIYNFLLYTNWSDDDNPRKKGPIMIAVYENEAFATILKTVIGERTVHGQEITIINQSKGANELGSNVHYTGSRKSSLRRLCNDSKTGSIPFIISDQPDAARYCSTINFFIQGHQLRFEINIELAARANVSFNARMLALARIIPTAK